MTQIAQFNIARAKYERNDPRIAEFFDVTPRINALAARSDGFIWRQDDEKGGPEVADFGEDRLMLYTLSVWRDVDSLKAFTWNTVHRQFRMRTREWFEDLGQAYLVCWHVADGHRPDGEEALEQLDALRLHGPSPERFGVEALKPEPA